MNERPIGKTKNAGWQIGVSRTIAVDIETAWDYLTSCDGLEVWLGPGVPTPITKGSTYQTTDGTTGEIRSLRPHDRIRLTWQPPNRPDEATVQIALTATPTGCTFRFHTERLYNNDERETMRQHWQTIADHLQSDLTTE